MQDRLRFSVLYGSSILHDQHPVCHRTDDANVVRNKHNGGSLGLAQQKQFFQHLFLHGNIQRGCRFIGKQNAGT